jgi:hypothetical protein
MGPSPRTLAHGHKTRGFRADLVMIGISYLSYLFNWVYQ